ncbi:putative 2-haloacid halidohydrolase Iva (plasmid) [Calothrix sp. NIES-4071]|nr:putative 2-haloacid halidohydrolase Iva [Calothrix sp. NIES-4071]BAZ64958.1 putative 2-haloacid halidohydrolase Iva [Calothrix sp. NIES-4105]
MKPTQTVVFDIIGTCFSLDKPKQKLEELGAPAHSFTLWFAQTLRDAFALSHAGSYRPLKEVLEAELPRTLKTLGVKADSVQMSNIVKSFTELELATGANESFKMLKEQGYRLVALTNGSEDSTRQLLERAGSINYFDQILSCDAVSKTKPYPDVYALIDKDVAGDVWMVAAHAWDIAGANMAKMKTAFITTEEKEYLSIYPEPDVLASSLLEAANKIIEVKTKNVF